MPERIDGTKDTLPLGGVLARAAFQFLVSFLIWGGLLFGSAGSLHWQRGWLHIGLWVATLTVNLIILLKVNPAVIQQRTKRQKLTEGFDKVLLAFMLPATLAMPVVAGVDAVRLQWTALPTWTILAGVVLHVAGDILVLWAMAVNPYLEKTVRIQEERGHQVITTGPYRYVRHPMYAGVIPMFAAMPLVLGSCWTFLPVGVIAVLLVIRTIYEERTLRNELPGYAAYAERTPYRLVPRLW